tara:strand:+ start:2550 stop:2945 length:396 start_codon:yes stop_codon:yes gene_type:complete
MSTVTITTHGKQGRPPLLLTDLIFNRFHAEYVGFWVQIRRDDEVIRGLIVDTGKGVTVVCVETGEYLFQSLHHPHIEGAMTMHGWEVTDIFNVNIQLESDGEAYEAAYANGKKRRKQFESAAELHVCRGED